MRPLRNAEALEARLVPSAYQLASDEKLPRRQPRQGGPKGDKK